MDWYQTKILFYLDKADEGRNGGISLGCVKGWDFFLKRFCSLSLTDAHALISRPKAHIKITRIIGIAP